MSESVMFCLFKVRRVFLRADASYESNSGEHVLEWSCLHGALGGCRGLLMFKAWRTNKGVEYASTRLSRGVRANFKRHRQHRFFDFSSTHLHPSAKENLS